MTAAAVWPAVPITLRPTAEQIDRGRAFVAWLDALLADRAEGRALDVEGAVRAAAPVAKGAP